MFNWLREKNVHVFFFFTRDVFFFLQEVHCTKETCDLWQNEWGYKAFFSCENSRRAGVAILFKNNFDFVLNKDYADSDGRFIILDIKMGDLEKQEALRCNSFTVFSKKWKFFSYLNLLLALGILYPGCQRLSVKSLCGFGQHRKFPLYARKTSGTQGRYPLANRFDLAMCPAKLSHPPSISSELKEPLKLL